MSTQSVTIQATRTIDSNNHTEYIGDTKRIFLAGGLTLQAARAVGSNNHTEYLGDTKRIFLAGGLTLQGTRLVGSNNHTEYLGDTRRIFLAGGLTIRGTRVIGGNNHTEYLGDTLRIRDITLNWAALTAYINRNVAQPPGIPWLLTEVTTAAWCWQLTRTDGTVYGFTSHDKDLVINGVTYAASTGFSPTAVETSDDLAVDNLEVDGVLTSDKITTDDISTGKYDFAKVTVFLCNWADPTDVIFVVRKGTLGQVKNGKYGFNAEIRGLMQSFQQKTGVVYQKHCRAALGDSKCQYPISQLIVSGKITMVNTDGTITTDRAAAEGYFDYGTITFTSGNNAGLSYETKHFVNGIFTPFLPWEHTVAINDTFTVQPGCNGNLSTCKVVFNNVNHFRGEPYIPGNDFQASYPTSSNTSSGQTTYTNTNNTIPTKTCYGTITAVSVTDNTITTNISDVAGIYDGGTLQLGNSSAATHLISYFTNGVFTMVDNAAVLGASVGGTVYIVQRS